MAAINIRKNILNFILVVLVLVSIALGIATAVVHSQYNDARNLEEKEMKRQQRQNLAVAFGVFALLSFVAVILKVLEINRQKIQSDFSNTYSLRRILERQKEQVETLYNKIKNRVSSIKSSIKKPYTDLTNRDDIVYDVYVDDDGKEKIIISDDDYDDDIVYIETVPSKKKPVGNQTQRFVVTERLPQVVSRSIRSPASSVFKSEIKNQPPAPAPAPAPEAQAPAPASEAAQAPASAQAPEADLEAASAEAQAQAETPIETRTGVSNLFSPTTTPRKPTKISQKIIKGPKQIDLGGTKLRKLLMQDEGSNVERVVNEFNVCCTGKKAKGFKASQFHVFDNPEGYDYYVLDSSKPISGGLDTPVISDVLKREKNTKIKQQMLSAGNIVDSYNNKIRVPILLDETSVYVPKYEALGKTTIDNVQKDLIKICEIDSFNIVDSLVKSRDFKNDYFTKPEFKNDNIHELKFRDFKPDGTLYFMPGMKT